MDLTREYLDQALATQTAELKAYADQQTAQRGGVSNEAIAVPMERHFAEVRDSVDVRAEVEALKLDTQRIKEALHLTS